MKKYELLRSGDSIIRVLEVREDKLLVIDCIKQTMPVWVDLSKFDSSKECSKEILLSVTENQLVDVDSMSSEQRKIMYDRYTMIAPILPFIADQKKRSLVL